MSLTRQQLLEYDVETWQHICQVRNLLGAVIRDLTRRQQDHDISKTVSPEREIMAEALPRLRGASYGTPEYEEMLRSIQPALDNHYRLNRHHPEHFPDGLRGMDLMDLVEMFCDWMAATLRHADGDIRVSIEKNKGRFGYSGDLEAIFANTAKQLRPPRI